MKVNQHAKLLVLPAYVDLDEKYFMISNVSGQCVNWNIQGPYAIKLSANKGILPPQ